MHFDIRRFICFLLDRSSTHIWIVLSLHLVCFSNILKLVGLESIHHLSADSTGSWSLGINLRLSFFKLCLLFFKFDLLISCKLEREHDLFFKLFFIGIHNLVNMKLHVWFCDLLLIDIGETSFSVYFILFGSNALVLNQIDHSDNYLDHLNQSK